MTGVVDRLFRLDGRCAVVTGGAGHLGRAMVSALAQAGARVYAAGRDAARLDALRADVAADGWSIETTPLDVTDGASRAALIERLSSETGRLDVLVNNAYAGCGGDLGVGEAAYMKAHRVTVAGPAALVDEVRPLLRAAAERCGDASVINIASIYGSVSPAPALYADRAPNPPSYGAAKAGLLQFTRHAACWLAAEGIRVNAISPGPFPSSAVAERDRAFVARLAERTPLGRIGRPDELQGALLFLAGPASSYVTGATLAVDGGWTAW